MSLSLINRIRESKAPPDCDCGPDDIAVLQEIIGEVGKQLITLKEGLARLVDDVPRINRVQMVERLEELIRDASV